MPKVSNFILARKVLELVCDEIDCDFVDCEVVFDQQSADWSFSDGAFHGPSKDVPGQTLARTLYSLVVTYLQSMPSINGKAPPQDKVNQILQYLFPLVNAFTMKEGFTGEGDRKDRIAMRLDQHPAVWMLIKDIICPLRQAEIRDFRVVAGHSHIADAVVYLTEKEIPNSSLGSDEFPFLFLNLDVESEAIRSAFLLYYAVQAHFPDEDPAMLIKSIFVDHFLKQDLIGFLRMAFENDEDVLHFFATLSLLTQMEEMEIMATAYAKGRLVKTAQSTLQGNWWFMGLIEKMLAPARGPDWSVTKGWESITRDLWERVEKERVRRGLAEVPFELLLRVSSEHLKKDDKKTLQGLLDATRVW